MSSKKHRKRIRRFHNRLIGVEDALPKKQSADLSPEEIRQKIKEKLTAIKDYSVLFPEISSEPIKLGVPLEVSFQIGEDPVQKKRVVFVDLVFNTEVYETQAQWQALQKLQIDDTKKLIMAPPARNRARVAPVLEVMHPTPSGGWSMTPVPIFRWYGNERINISEIVECPAATFLISRPHYKFWDMMWLCSYVDRIIDGMEFFKN